MVDVCSARGLGGEGGPYQSDERIFVYEIPYVPHFEVEIGRPYLPYGRHIAESFQLDDFNLRRGWKAQRSDVRVRVGGVTYEPVHVPYLTRDASDSRPRRGLDEEYTQRVCMSICLYVYLTHQTGTYGSTMRNMRSTSSRGTYSRIPRNLYLLSTTYKQQIPMG